MRNVLTRRAIAARAAIVVALTMALLGCGDLKNLVALSSALQEKYHVTPNVNIMNGSHLLITFQNMDDLAKTDSAGRERFAREVATFAKAHYPEANHLEGIAVTFATVRSAGPLTMTNVDAPFSYHPADLH